MAILKTTALLAALFQPFTWPLACAADASYFPVPMGGKWGYIDGSGAVVLQPVYDGAAYFAEGRAPVKIGGLFGYIDRTGAVVIPPTFDEARFFLQGIAPVRRGERWGYIDFRGDFAIPLQFEPPAAFRKT